MGDSETIQKRASGRLLPASRHDDGNPEAGAGRGWSLAAGAFLGFASPNLAV